MAVSIICNLVNVGLNYLLIYGKWGMPEMGVNGAAVATLISRILMVVLMLWYIRTHKRFIKYIKGLFILKFNSVAIRKLLQVGIPSGLQYIFEVSAFSIAAVIAGTLGANALASHQIAINIASVSYMAATGLGSAATIRIGNQSGRGDVRNLRMASRSLFVMTAAWMGFAGLIILLFRNTLAGFYSNDEIVLALTGKMLIVVVIFQLSDGLQAVGLGALRGFTDVRVPTMITFFAYWMVALPAAWLLAKYTTWGAMGIWYALAGGLTISAILLLSRFQMLVNRFAVKMGSA
jgi:MATE family multidrug resistance protein